MREIKFKVLNKITGEILPVANIDFKLKIVTVGGIADGVLGKIEFYSEWKFKNVELMEYTGVKDANGVEIYEGDILKTDDGYLAKVDFYDGEFKAIEDDVSLNLADYAISSSVVGNIYENPELLNLKSN
ncbi:YopX domain-containing protein [Campylobacter blaseri]|uniref:YopX protein domain-containing protein n=1 Tax=Campylobacter blaseri TaxID=2042961 RepID=A0A2P8R2Q6_9BACT|nr:YopX family protein [Campylobacter blaseri]PSM52769.1 hypothetical protein CQ405_03330 [Campylobacter blaseri]PSM54417.1 hypothetical protein CRN67_03330 [Campylobacter blaseri]QKF86080.1 YopX domain-containing protein [Campylobacter blaseri]